MKRIIGIGNALVDLLVHIPSDDVLLELGLPKGSMQLIDKSTLDALTIKAMQLPHSYATGGSAANTVKALSGLGASPAYIGKIGGDTAGNIFRTSCAEAGIQASLIKADGATGTAATFISPDGQRTFGTYLGVASTLCAGELSPEQFSGYTYLYIEGYLVQSHALVCRALALAKQLGLTVCLDLGSYNIVEAEKDFFIDLLTNSVDIVFANEEESAALTGETPEEALHTLAQLCETVVVKVGAKGAYAQRGDETVFVPAEAIADVKDTTGAGDYFAAGCLYAWANGGSLRSGLQAGTLLAGQVIQTVGTTLAPETWTKLRAQLSTLVNR